jgi:hypothetical protein
MATKSQLPVAPPTESHKFRTVLGIITPESLKPPIEAGHYDHCDEPNKGLYSRLCERESTRRGQYRVCVFVLDFCYLAQIVISAALTALGASQSSFIAITTFGALNVAWRASWRCSKA